MAQLVNAATQLASTGDRLLRASIPQRRAARPLEAGFSASSIRLIEIQALARAGDAVTARALLDADPNAYGADERARLEATILSAEGSDPVTAYKQAYEASKTPESLRMLIAVLSQREDYRSIGPNAETLYSMTDDGTDIAYAAYAYASASDDENFVRDVEAHPDILARDSGAARQYGWLLFRRGRLRDAKRIADSLLAKPKARDLDLEIAIAIETGEWESLSAPLTACLQLADTLPALQLIRAAHISQASGQGPLMDLIEAAVSKGDFPIDCSKLTDIAGRLLRRPAW